LAKQYFRTASERRWWYRDGCRNHGKHRTQFLPEKTFIDLMVLAQTPFSPTVLKSRTFFAAFITASKA
jgi:hypothetical protein